MAGKAERVARLFSRLGWTGVCIQLVLLLGAIFIFAWVSLGGVPGGRPVLGRTDYLGLVGLAILVFTTFWSYRYTRLARRMAEPASRPPRRAVVNTLWVGLFASGTGVAISMVLLVIEVARLLILVMKAPQAGVPVIQMQAENRAAWVSAIDVVSLLADVSTLAAELMVFGVTLWLLFRITQAAEDYDSAQPIPSS
jgi:Protein of unknown function (DUF3611)